MAFIPSSGSVVAFQSNQSSLLGTMQIAQGTSIATVHMVDDQVVSSMMAIVTDTIIHGRTTAGGGGYVEVKVDPSGAMVTALGSVVTFQGTSPWIINQPSPSIIAMQQAGSIMAVSGTFTSGNTSVTTFQGGAWTTSVVGTVTAAQGGNAGLASRWPIIITNGTQTADVSASSQLSVAVNNTPTVNQGTSPWVVNQPSPSIIAYQLAGSIMAVSATFNTGNSSVQLLAGTAAIGSVTALQGTNPWFVGNSSVSQVGQWNVNAGSIVGTYQEKASAGIASALGQVMLFKNNATTSTLAAVSTLDPLPVQGSVMTLQGTNPWQVNTPTPSYLSIQPAGSILAAAVTQTTSPWVVNVPTPSYLSIQPGGSVLNANISGSVAAVFTTGNSSVQLISTSASIMVNNRATFGGNNAWTQTDSVVAFGGVRNDTMSSMSAADQRYTPWAVGPIGETIVANSPITKWVRGTSSVFTGTSVQVLAAQGTSIFTYVTGIQITNASANNVYITFTGGLGGITSTLGYTVAPANGGSNMYIPNAWVTGANSGFSASISGVASVYLAVQGFISKT